MKMLVETREAMIGSTLIATWFANGAVPTSIASVLISNSETLINSVAAVGSTNGFYTAANPIPNTPAWYVNEWIAIISANTYRSRQFVKGVLPEVD